MGRITYLRKPGKVSSGRVNGRRAMNGSQGVKTNGFDWKSEEQRYRKERRSRQKAWNMFCYIARKKRGIICLEKQWHAMRWWATDESLPPANDERRVGGAVVQQEEGLCKDGR